MLEIQKEIDMLNKLIETAIYHGAGMGGGYDEGSKLKTLMEEYLDLKGLSDDYYVGNPDSDENIDLNSVLCFKKSKDEVISC